MPEKRILIVVKFIEGEDKTPSVTWRFVKATPAQFKRISKELEKEEGIQVFTSPLDEFSTDLRGLVDEIREQVN